MTIPFLLRSQGGVLHVVSEIRFRWVGWSIAAAVLVLALTFMSNRSLGAASLAYDFLSLDGPLGPGGEQIQVEVRACVCIYADVRIYSM